MYVYRMDDFDTKPIIMTTTHASYFSYRSRVRIRTEKMFKNNLQKPNRSVKININTTMIVYILVYTCVYSYAVNSF